MSESYESNTSNIGGLFAKHLDAQWVNVTTVRSIRKATRYRPSTLVTRRDTTIMHPQKPLCSGWAMDMAVVAQEDRSEAHRVQPKLRSNTVTPGGQLRLSDCHK